MGLSRADLQTIATRTGRKVVAAWSDRNAGAQGSIVGVVMHHTGSAWGTAIAPTLAIVREGRSDLLNALCNFYIDRAGTIYLITEKIPWHAGVGTYRGITDGNGHFLGIEAESDGVHWTTDTIDAYVALVAEIVRFLGVDPAVWAIRHAVWATPPGRKTDFAGINEPVFRARINTRLHGAPPTGGFLMALTDTQQQQIYDALIEGDGKGPRNNFAWLYNQLQPVLADIKDQLHGGMPKGQNNFHWVVAQILTALGQLDPAKPLTAADIAALIPADIATDVADELAKRIAA